jgi:cytochrome c peroxidase
MGIIALSFLQSGGCKKMDAFYGTPLPFEVPQGFPQPAYSFSNNPVTKEGFELGRKLFYEGRLSLDGNFPCASCHQQEAAFTTKEHDLGHGYNNAHTVRNPVGLANLAWFTEYYHDGSTKSLEEISLRHITSPTEMAETMNGVVAKLKGDTMYQRLFREAYGDAQVTGNRILKSLSQFVINMVSASSKYDRVKKGAATFSAQEQRGYSLFQKNCASCHAEPLFTDLSYRNIGLPLSPFFLDYGRMTLTGRSSDSLKFRVPSLRNVAVTGTYTHDGRIGVLKTMVNHYRTGIVQSATLDPLLKNGLALTNAETDDLVAFLKTLTDSSYLVDRRFGH